MLNNQNLTENQINFIKQVNLKAMQLGDLWIDDVTKRAYVEAEILHNVPLCLEVVLYINSIDHFKAETLVNSIKSTYASGMSSFI